jgi:hypothetical protein
MAFNVRKQAVTMAVGLALVLPAAALRSLNPQDRDQERQGQRDDRDRKDRNDRNDRNGDYANSKYYQRGLKDGGHDRDKHRGERAHKKRFKNDRDRQAYEAGYDAGYRGDRH